MGTERQSPDAILELTNLTGTVSEIQDDPDDPDSDWLDYVANNVDTVCRVSFPTPTGHPTVGAGLQEFKIWVRQNPDGAGDDPTVRIELYEDGGQLAVILADTAVPSTSGELHSATWNANLLSNADGSLVECYIYGTAVGGSPSNRCTVEVGAVEWNVEYDEPPPPISGSGGVSLPVSQLAGTGALVFPGSGGVSLPVSSLAADGTLTFVGSGGVVLPVSQLSGTGVYTPLAITGSGGVALPVSQLLGDGLLVFAGSGGLLLPVSALAGTGTVSGGAGSQVNTRDRRFSMIGLALCPLRVMPNPDGGFNAGDRAQLMFLYRGIPLTGLPVEFRRSIYRYAAHRRR